VADGLVVVVDSPVGREGTNVVAFRRLRRDLSSAGIDPNAVPMVFQANKRDLADVVTMDWVREHFRTERCAHDGGSRPDTSARSRALREVPRLAGAIE
jgi:signal recognition particle receptor subunit beta